MIGIGYQQVDEGWWLRKTQIVDAHQCHGRSTGGGRTQPTLLCGYAPTSVLGSLYCYMSTAASYHNTLTTGETMVVATWCVCGSAASRTASCTSQRRAVFNTVYTTGTPLAHLRVPGWQWWNPQALRYGQQHRRQRHKVHVRWINFLIAIANKQGNITLVGCMIVASGSNESGQKACAMITARPLSWAVSLAHLHVA
jgi:hypothetical protein